MTARFGGSDLRARADEATEDDVLKRLPAAELKIDRGFVRDQARDSEDAAIVSAIVALEQTLKRDIVAEGETAEQQAFLAQLCCDTLQGFLPGRPVPRAEFMETLLPVKCR